MPGSRARHPLSFSEDLQSENHSISSFKCSLEKVLSLLQQQQLQSIYILNSMQIRVSHTNELMVLKRSNRGFRVLTQQRALTHSGSGQIVSCNSYTGVPLTPFSYKISYFTIKFSFLESTVLIVCNFFCRKSYFMNNDQGNMLRN